METSKTRKSIQDNTKKCMDYVDKSGPAKHVFETAHHLDFEGAKVTIECTGYFKRNMMESIEIIKSENNTMNQKAGPYNISKWSNFIKKNMTSG